MIIYSLVDDDGEVFDTAPAEELLDKEHWEDVSGKNLSITSEDTDVEDDR